MPVHQVEDYYLNMNGLSLSEAEKTSLEELLSNENYSNYEFQDDDTVLIVDDIPSEFDGDNLEDMINELLGK